MKHGREEMEDRNTGDLKKLYHTVGETFEKKMACFFQLVSEGNMTVPLLLLYVLFFS